MAFSMPFQEIRGFSLSFIVKILVQKIDFLNIRETFFLELGVEVLEAEQIADISVVSLI